MKTKHLILVWLGLMVGFVATLLLGQWRLGVFYTPVAVVIASVQALLVIAFFMEAKYSSRLTWFFAAAGIYWLGFLFVLSLGDYFSRGWLK
jgi:cytochrome c oxidase subunit 4